MTEIAKSMAHLNDGLNAVRDDVEARLAKLLEALQAATQLAEGLKSDEDRHDKELKQLRERAEGQNELIETLTQEAQESQALRDEVRERDLEIEKLSSALDSKKELVTALRRQIGEADQLKTAARHQDKKIFEQQHELDRRQQALDSARERIAGLEADLTALTDQASETMTVDNVEVAALKSELDARKSMIRSLKADAKRAESLEAQLEAKREAVDALEVAVDRHATTIAELRQSVDAWKAKYQAVKGEKLDDGTETMTELPAFTDTELEALKALEETCSDAPGATIAIDMRDALKEARRHKANS
jgi:chromosome segregation ATPase